MDKLTKNKIFTWLLGLLLLANAATLAFFWLSKPPMRPIKESPKDFLIRELNFDVRQQEQFEVLKNEHHAKTEALRDKVKAAKDEMFDLIREPGVSDSAKRIAAKKVSLLLEEIDINTLNHFQKVRALCNSDQKDKFDGVIRQVTRMMGNQRPGGEVPPK